MDGLSTKSSSLQKSKDVMKMFNLDCYEVLFAGQFSLFKGASKIVIAIQGGK